MTIGHRISTGRKQLGLTQEQLAEQLGVTAQAVSKWENDQSCPDINTLPKLAAILGTTTDSLLGCEKAPIQPTPPPDTAPPDRPQWDTGKRTAISISIFVLLVGCLTLLDSILDWEAGFWELLWPSALLVLGLDRLTRRLSFFSLCCTLCGLYFLLDAPKILDLGMDRRFLLPIILLSLGVSLLIDALRPKRTASSPSGSGLQFHDDRFRYTASFGEQHQKITLPHLSGGEITVSFGEFQIDLREVQQLSDGCTIDAQCSFGSLTLLVPARYQVLCDGHTAFASIETQGEPAPVPSGTISLQCDTSFGQTTIRYL